jgi:hypothetical protein
MTKDVQGLTILFVVLIISSGCVDSLIRKNHYGGLVRTQISSQEIARQVIEYFGTLLEPHESFSEVFNKEGCQNFAQKRLPITKAPLSIAICRVADDENQPSTTVSITIITNGGRDLAVRKEMDSVLFELEKNVLMHVSKSKLSVQPIAFYFF